MTKATILSIALLGVGAPVSHAALHLAAPSWVDGDAAAGSRTYREARRALRDEDWSGAARLFGEAAAEGGGEAAGALYWQAYALNRDGRAVAALEAVRRLLSEHPGSSWADDARALEVEIRGPAAGEPEGDDGDLELKLYALNGLMSASPEKALPVLERVIDGDQPRQLRERALFVVANNGGEAGRELLRDVAMGRRSPDLRREAVKYLGVSGRNEDLLLEIYRGSGDRSTKEDVLEGLMVGGSRDELLSIAREETDAELGRQAVRMLAVSGGREEIRELYREEEDVAKRQALLETAVVSGDTELLEQALESASDEASQIRAIELLGVTGRGAGELLTELYGRRPSPAVRKQILESMMVAGLRDGLYEIARDETDPELRGEAIQMLGVAGGREELRRLWASAADAAVREKILETAVVSGDAEILRRAMAESDDPAVQGRAVELLGVVGGAEGREALRELYRAAPPPEVKEKVLSAMMIAGDSDGLIEVVRTESDPELKRAAVRFLSMVGSDEAIELLSEVIE